MAKRSAPPRTPIWARPAPGARHPRLNRDQIAAAALAIADAEGFDAVSMRRIATELDAGTMTLYYYVKTKDDLVALMDDAIMAEVLLPAEQMPRGWRAGLTAIAHRSRDVFRRHPWALHALQGARVGPHGLAHMEQSLSVLGDAPLDDRAKLHLLSIVDDYVFGHVLRASETFTHPIDQTSLRSITEFFKAQLASGLYPNLQHMFGGRDALSVFVQMAQWMSDDTRFETGLTALLDGLEHQMLGGDSAHHAAARGPAGDRSARAARTARTARRADERVPRRRSRG